MKLLSGCPKSHETQRYQQFYISYSMRILGTKNEKSIFDSEICARFKKKMRKKFEQQLHLGQVAIGDVKFPSSYYKSRDEQPPVLIALLHNSTHQN